MDIPVYKELFIYTWNLDLGVEPSKTRAKLQSKQGSCGFQVYTYTHMRVHVYIYMTKTLVIYIGHEIPSYICYTGISS